MSQNKLIPDMKKLKEALNGDKDLVLFFVTWIKNGLNAGKAYKELHPNVDAGSALTLGSRMLRKVDKFAVMSAYDLTDETYFVQMKKALLATKWNDFTGEREEDHKTRRSYHQALGKILGIEKEEGGTGIQINVIPIQSFKKAI